MESYAYDSKYHCVENDVMIICSNEPHTFVHTTDCKYIVIKFMPEILFSYEQSVMEFEYIYTISNIMNNRSRVIPGTNELRELMLDAVEIFVKQEYSNELLVRADVLRICAYIFKF